MYLWFLRAAASQKKALSLMTSRWAREVEPQALVWVVCSKTGYGCWVVVPVARRVP